MGNEWLICTVTADGGQLICTCFHCGWVSPPASDGKECGSLRDGHRALHQQQAVTVGA